MLTGKPTILIVEDHPDVRESLELLFGVEDFEVTSAEHGRAALSVLERQSPDLVLTDLMMPEMDGLELIRRLRGQQEFAGILIVAVSTDNEAIAEAVKLGATASLCKPLDFDCLLQQVKRILSDRRATHQWAADSPPAARHPAGPAHIEASP